MPRPTFRELLYRAVGVLYRIRLLFFISLSFRLSPHSSVTTGAMQIPMQISRCHDLQTVPLSRPLLYFGFGKLITSDQEPSLADREARGRIWHDCLLSVFELRGSLYCEVANSWRPRRSLAPLMRKPTLLTPDFFSLFSFSGLRVVFPLIPQR